MRGFKSRIALSAISLVLLLHVDSVVAVAIATDWISQEVIATDRARIAELLKTGGSYDLIRDIENRRFDCSLLRLCPRLPLTWIPIQLGLGILLALLPASVGFGFLRTLPGSKQTGYRSGSRRKGLRVSAVAWTEWFLSTSVDIGLAIAFLRFVASTIGPDTQAFGLAVLFATCLQGAALGVAAWLVAKIHTANSKPIQGEGASVSVFLHRHRFSLAVMALYVAALLMFEITRDQWLDALRYIEIVKSDGFSLGLWLIASTALLSAVLYETGTRIEHQYPSIKKRPDWSLGTRRWIACGVICLSLGLLLLWRNGGGLPLLVPGVLFVILGLLEHAQVSDFVEEIEPEPRIDPSTMSRSQASAFGVICISLVPLITLLAGLSLSVIDPLLLDASSLASMGSPIILTVATAAVIAYGWPHPESASGSIAAQRRPTLIYVAGASSALALVWTLVHQALSDLPVGPTVVSLVTGVLIYFAGRKWSKRRSQSGLDSHRASTLHLALALAGAITVGVHVDPHGISNTVGAAALFNIAAAAMVVFGYYLNRTSQLFRAPQFLFQLGVYRFPAATISLAGVLLLGRLAPLRINDLEVLKRENPSASSTTPTVEQVFTSWVGAQPEFAKAKEAGTPASQSPVPLMLVASHGGGIRAAYWTALVMDCIVGVSAREANADNTHETVTCDEKRRNDAEWRTAAGRVLLASGVSGGAVGLQAYARHLLTNETNDPAWIDQQLGRDLLSAPAGWGLFHDLPNRLIGFQPAPGGQCALRLFDTCWSQDRSAILAQAVARTDASADFGLRGIWDSRRSSDGNVQRRAVSVPLLVTNSSTPLSGRRAVTSAADLGPWPSDWRSSRADLANSSSRPVFGAAEVSDMLCGSSDISLSTAAVLSARFPVISSPGRIGGSCGWSSNRHRLAEEGHPACLAADQCATQMLDGGTMDNSGLLTIAQLWPELKRLVLEHNSSKSNQPIAVFVVNVDNHYLNENEQFDYSRNRPLSELKAAATTATQGNAQAEAVARGILISGLPNTCFETIAPEAHPAVSAPLGWLLSEVTRRQLRVSLTRPGATDPWSANRYWLRRLQSWLDPAKDEVEFTPPLSDCIVRPSV